MKQYPSREELQALFDYCPNTGKFYRRTSRRRHKAGSEAGGKASGRIYLDIAHEKYLAHRCAWIMAYGTSPEVEIDHIDRNPLNNALWNLRLASSSDNKCNKRAQSNNKLGVKGVHMHQGRFRVKVNKNGVVMYDAHFDTLEEAIEARALAAAEHHGDFACGTSMN